MLRWLGFLVFLVLALAGGAYLAAGQTTPPTLSIDLPAGPVGQGGTLQVTARSQRALFATLEATLEQNGQSFPLFALDNPEQATVTGATAKRTDVDHLVITRPIGKTSLPQLQEGKATITVTAARTSFLRIRDVHTSVSKQIEVKLEPPRIAVLSTTHYVNHGGSEMVIYRVTPPDASSGVRVGDVEYQGYPASGAGVAGADPSLKVAFFALLQDQPLHTPVVAFARDGAGNQATASFVDNVFEKTFRKSRIPIDDRFLGRVVPEILAHSPQVRARRSVDNPNDLLADFLLVNGDVRKINAEQILALAATSAPQVLWKGPFLQLGNSQVEAAFADARTYVYNGKDVDQQTHLGFDLAVTAHVPVLAANGGRIVNADWLGIYGNCVIIDHGMGVASLYGHMSSIDVKVGDSVARGQVLGRSGMTGLAGGDHVHFTMLVGGHPVNPVEWWDAHWIQDRIERKLAEAGATAPTAAAAR